MPVLVSAAEESHIRLRRLAAVDDGGSATSSPEAAGDSATSSPGGAGEESNMDKLQDEVMEQFNKRKKENMRMWERGAESYGRRGGQGDYGGFWRVVFVWMGRLAGTKFENTALFVET